MKSKILSTTDFFMAHLKMLLCCQPTFNVPSFLKTLFVISAQFGSFLKYSLQKEEVCRTLSVCFLSYIYSFHKHTCSSHNKSADLFEVGEMRYSKIRFTKMRSKPSVLEASIGNFLTFETDSSKGYYPSTTTLNLCWIWKLNGFEPCFLLLFFREHEFPES